MTRRLYNHKNNINKKSSGIKREQASVNKAYIHHKSCHRRYQNRERYYYIWYKNQTAESGTPDGRDGMNHPWMKVGVDANCLRCSVVWFCTIRVLSDAGNLPFFFFYCPPSFIYSTRWARSIIIISLFFPPSTPPPPPTTHPTHLIPQINNK